MVASYYGQVDVVKYLTNKEVDVDAKNKEGVELKSIIQTILFLISKQISL